MKHRMLWALLALLLAFGSCSTNGGEPYTIRFITGGGTTEYATLSVEAPDYKVTTLPAVPTNDGYGFDGWNTAIDGTGTKIAVGSVISGDTIVYDSWTTLTYAITFDSQEATVAADPSTKSVTSPGLTLGTLPTAPTKDGYSFAGWYTEPAGAGTRVTGATRFSSAATVYAAWMALSRTVYFDSQGADTEASPANLTVTSPAMSLGVLPTEPVKAGYDFGGWFTGKAGAGSEVGLKSTILTSQTLYANWVTLSYTVTFDSQSATVAATPVTKHVSSPSLTLVTLPTPPSKDGYDFAGWYTQPGGAGKRVTEASTFTADATVYAAWTAHSWVILFDSQGADVVASPANATVTSPSRTLGSLPIEPTKAGYTFGGWYTAKSGAGTEVVANTDLSGNMTLYAHWVAFSYLVSFDSQGATVAATPDSKHVSSPDCVVGSFPTAPTKVGYDFGGWYTKEGGKGVLITESTPVTKNLTVYACWNGYTRTVTFDSQSATVAATPASVSVSSPATTISAAGRSLPTEPSRVGYLFGGWYSGTNGSGTAFSATTPIAANATVYAWWKAYAYVVTYSAVDADTGPTPATLTVSSPATSLGIAPTPPKRAGYTFSGWYTAEDASGAEFTPATTVTGNLTVYAHWKNDSGINATTSFPEAGTVTLTVDAASVAKGTAVKATVKESGYARYQWYLDAATSPLSTTGAGGNSYTYATATLAPGVHTVFVTVADAAGNLASATCRFTVTN